MGSYERWVEFEDNFSALYKYKTSFHVEESFVITTVNSKMLFRETITKNNICSVDKRNVEILQ